MIAGRVVTGDLEAAASWAALRYGNGADRGLSGTRSAKRYRCTDANRPRVRDAATLSRIRALAILPASTSRRRHA